MDFKYKSIQVSRNSFRALFTYIIIYFFGLKLSKDEIIRIEGGLGSQLLGLLSILDSKSQTDRKVYYDTSYFTSRPNDQDGKLSIWPWKLERYGYSLQDMNTNARIVNWKERISRVENLDKNRTLLSKRWRSFQEYAEVLFCDHYEVNHFLRELTSENCSEYTVVHIRRGDYVQVASHLIEVSEYLSLMSRIQHILSPHIITISDSKIDEDYKKQLIEMQGEDKCFFIEGDTVSEYVLHDLMRCADVLICANSTFSFTAGILSIKKGLVFVPIVFYKEKNIDFENMKFNSAGSFYLLS